MTRHGLSIFTDLAITLRSPGRHAPRAKTIVLSLRSCGKARPECRRRAGELHRLQPFEAILIRPRPDGDGRIGRVDVEGANQSIRSLTRCDDHTGNID